MRPRAIERKSAKRVSHVNEARCAAIFTEGRFPPLDVVCVRAGLVILELFVWLEALFFSSDPFSFFSL